MTLLAIALDEYLGMRQGLGIRLRVPAGLLRRFVAFLDGEGQEVITRELALKWAMAPRHAQPATWAWRLGIARRFAMWRQATDPRTEVPQPVCFHTDSGVPGRTCTPTGRSGRF